MDRDTAVSYVHKLLATLLEKGGSDLYITAEAAPSIKLNSELVALTNQVLTESHARMLVRSIMNDRQLEQFEEDMESNKDDGRLPAVEVVINTPLMADLILKGDIPGMKDLTAKSREHGMRTFDQALFDLIETRKITVHEGLRNADSQNDLRLRLKLESRFAKDNDFFKGLDNMSMEPLEQRLK